MHGKTRHRPQIDTQRARGARSLRGDESGAIMVIGIFMAVLLVGLMYYVWGIGGALLHRERMQDAADTAAFGAAVIHARGMNILALLNIIMAALAAVSTALQVIANIATASAIAATLTCLGCGPYCSYCCNACEYVGPYWSSSSDMHDIADEVEDIITELVEATHATAEAVRAGTPLAAQALVVQYGLVTYAETTEAGVLFPLYEELPAEDDPTDWPCDNKVRGPASIMALIGSPAGVEFNLSEWFAMGLATGIWTVYYEAREWCEDGYFQRVEEDAEMGREPFQLRTLMYGEPDFDWMRRGVAVATWGESDGTAGMTEALLPLAHVSLAQSEFFYDDQVEREEWLWHMNWRARLRRFRVGTSGFGAACGTAGGACGSLPGLSSVMVH